MIAKQTENCVRCLTRKAVIWGGHVMKGKKYIIAGWCRRCHKVQGFVGHYVGVMGAK